MTENYSVRFATPDDAELIANHRCWMFEDMGLDLADNINEVYIPWVRNELTHGRYIGALIETDSKVVAGGGLWILEYPPHLNTTETTRAYIYNIYTEPAYRRRGLARRLMQILLECARERRIRHLMLHASDKGRALYESLGFEASNEMVMLLD